METCKICGKSFVERHKLNDHMRVHTGEKFKCEHCGREYAAKYKLNQHIRQSHG